MTIYYGNSNKAKTIKDFYISINNNAKRIKYGYIGVESKAKLFYLYNIPGAKMNQRGYWYYGIYYNSTPSGGIQTIINTSDSEYYLWHYKSTASSANELYCSGNYIYLYENSCSFIYGECQANIHNLNFKYVKELNNFCISWNSIIGTFKDPDFNNVINAIGAFSLQSKFKGPPAFGDNIINAYDMYNDCYNMTGSPKSGAKVVNMYKTYNNCVKLTGVPVIGNNVIDLSNCYHNCTNLGSSTIEVTCPSTLKNMENAFVNIKEIKLNFHFYGNEARYAFLNVNAYGNIWFHDKNCGIFQTFYGKESYNKTRLNIYVNKTITNSNFSYLTTSWTSMTNGFYNSKVNVYIYNNL